MESRLRGGGGGELLKDDMGSSISKVRKTVGRRGGSMRKMGGGTCHNDKPSLLGAKVVGEKMYRKWIGVGRWDVQYMGSSEEEDEIRVVSES